MSVDIRSSHADVSFVKLSGDISLESFVSKIEEYTEFLKKDALQYQEFLVTNTYLLLNRKTASILAYMSVIADSIRTMPIITSGPLWLKSLKGWRWRAILKTWHAASLQLMRMLNIIPAYVSFIKRLFSFLMKIQDIRKKLKQLVCAVIYLPVPRTGDLAALFWDQDGSLDEVTVRGNG